MKNLSPAQEKQLLDLLKQGDEEAFKSVYKHYKNKLVFFAYRLTKSTPVAEEIVQDVFVKIWTARDQINTDFSFNAYIYRITHNMVVNYLRRVASEEKAIKMLWQNIEEEQNYIDDIVKSNEFDQIAQNAIEKLSPQKRQIFEMSRQSNYTHKEIADKLGISPNTVKNHMVESLKFIRSYLVINGEMAL